jgi:hypothetical protein
LCAIRGVLPQFHIAITAISTSRRGKTALGDQLA